MGASSDDDRAGRATHQAPTGLDHEATIPLRKKLEREMTEEALRTGIWGRPMRILADVQYALTKDAMRRTNRAK